jgi:hypothetical protein
MADALKPGARIGAQEAVSAATHILREGTAAMTVGAMAQLHYLWTGRVRVGWTVGATEGAVEPTCRYLHSVA